MKNFVLAAALVGSTTIGFVLPRAAPSEQAQRPSANSLKEDMRTLWGEHAVWTRDYIVAAVADAPDQKAAAGRLMKNQDDIGGVITVYYGKAAGDTLTGLLKTHISIAVDLINAAKAGDNAGQHAADARWQQNGVEIADFLSKANPNWPRAALVDMMKMHLSRTMAEVEARLTKNWDADIRAFDEVYRHILMMSDTLSAGIVKQFPSQFTGPEL